MEPILERVTASDWLAALDLLDDAVPHRVSYRYYCQLRRSVNLDSLILDSGVAQATPRITIHRVLVCTATAKSLCVTNRIVHLTGLIH
jgi:hypothetical protein